MKKYLFIAAVAALAACTNETLVDAPSQETQEQAISFGTGFNSMTRAENSDASNYSALETYHNNFQVWGYKFVEELLDDNTLAQTYQDVFSGTDAQSKLYWKNNDWYYSPARFWDKSAEYYDFFAAAPYNDTKWEITLPADNAQRYQEAYLTYAGAEIDGYSLALSTDTPTGQPDDKFNSNDGTGKDLMIASDIRVTPNLYTKDRVHFYFNHILSRLNIAVKVGQAILEDPSVVVKLQEVKVYNMPSVGDFNESLVTGDELAAGTTERWTNQRTPFTVGFPSAQVKSVEADGMLMDDTYQYVYQGLVIPQVVEYEGNLKLNGTNVTADSKPYLNIKYTINGEKFNYFYNLAQILGDKYLKDTKGRIAYMTDDTNNYVYSEDGVTFYAKDDDRRMDVAFYDGEHYYCILRNGAMSPLYKDPTTGNLYSAYDPTTGVYSKNYLCGAIVMADENGLTCPVKLTDLDPSMPVPTADIPFNEGWQNNLMITINPTNIQFDADVYEWGTKYDYPYDVE